MKQLNGSTSQGQINDLSNPSIKSKNSYMTPGVYLTEYAQGTFPTFLNQRSITPEYIQETYHQARLDPYIKQRVTEDRRRINWEVQMLGSLTCALAEAWLMLDQVALQIEEYEDDVKSGRNPHDPLRYSRRTY